MHTGGPQGGRWSGRGARAPWGGALDREEGGLRLCSGQQPPSPMKNARNSRFKNKSHCQKGLGLSLVSETSQASISPRPRMRERIPVSLQGGEVKLPSRGIKSSKELSSAYKTRPSLSLTRGRVLSLPSEVISGTLLSTPEFQFLLCQNGNAYC